MRRFRYVVIVFALVAAWALADAGNTELWAQREERVVIGLMTIRSHPSLDLVWQGTRDALADAGFVEGENIEILEGNAEGDIPTLNTIAQRFVDENVDVIIATSTPAAQAAYNVTRDLGGPPLFFNAVSNPFAAGLATAPDDHPEWVLGKQLLDPVAEVMEMILDLRPDTQTIGILHDPSEANSVFLLGVAEEAAEALGLTLEVATVSNTGEVQTAAEALLGRNIDAFMGINDNTVMGGFEAWTRVANDNGIPLFGTSASMPPRGAAVAFGVNPYQEGLDSGAMVAQYLRGELDIATTPIDVQDAVVLVVNPDAAAIQGLDLPEAFVAEADQLVE